MSISKSIFVSILIAGVVVGLVSCSDDDPTLDPIVATTFTNLPADPATSYGPMGEPLGKTGKFTFFSFETGGLIDHADSASAKWDIGFNGISIIVNSGTSGLGTAQAMMQDGIFDEITAAPEDGYKSDNVIDKGELFSQTGTDNLAISSSLVSGNGWGLYDGTAHTLSPKAGKVIFVKTNGGRYAKMEILSYYKDSPNPITMSSMPDYYTFRYVYQPNDTKEFE